MKNMHIIYITESIEHPGKIQVLISGDNNEWISLYCNPSDVVITNRQNEKFEKWFNKEPED